MYLEECLYIDFCSFCCEECEYDTRDSKKSLFEKNIDFRADWFEYMEDRENDYTF